MLGFPTPFAEGALDGLAQGVEPVHVGGHDLVVRGAAIFAGTLTASGTETITFTAEDESGASVDATADFIVAPVNDAPSIDSAAITAATEDLAYSYTITTSDVDGDALTISATTLPAWLTLTDNGNGTATLTGTPTNAQVGDHGVVLEVSDGSLTATQSFTITVANTNDAPVVTAVDLGSIAEDGSLLITQADLLTGSSDPDSDPLTAVNLTLASGSGALVDNADGTWTFTPTTDWNGAVGFAFDVSDGTTSTANTASLTVTAVNDVPTTSGLANQALAEDFADYTIDLKTIFADVETTDANLIYTVAGNSNIGVSIDANGVATISSTANFNGTDGFTSIASDATGRSDTTSVSLTVTAVNDFPVASADSFTTAEDSSSGSRAAARETRCGSMPTSAAIS